MEAEYNRSAKKEEEIKNAFEKIKEEIGIHEPKELLNVFNTLHQKTVTMESFVQDLSREIEELDNKIIALKEEIQLFEVRGATFDQNKREEKTVKGFFF
jgi:predicted  nucleic acid-binding Zn-ribbon protein